LVLLVVFVMMMMSRLSVATLAVACLSLLLLCAPTPATAQSSNFVLSYKILDAGLVAFDWTAIGSAPNDSYELQIRNETSGAYGAFLVNGLSEPYAVVRNLQVNRLYAFRVRLLPAGTVTVPVLFQVPAWQVAANATVLWPAPRVSFSQQTLVTVQWMMHPNDTVDSGTEYQVVMRSEFDPPSANWSIRASGKGEETYSASFALAASISESYIFAIRRTTLQNDTYIYSANSTATPRMLVIAYITLHTTTHAHSCVSERRCQLTQ
jgi:hypothetical protein